MKKALSMLCAATMAMTLSGCSFGPTPDEVVNSFMASVRSYGAEPYQEYLAAPGNSNPLPDIHSEDLDSFFKENASQIKYSISRSIKGEDTADVSLSVTYNDASNIAVAAMDDYISAAFDIALDNDSDVQLTEATMKQLITDILDEKVSTMDTVTTTTDFEIQCIKTDDGWKISEVPQEMQSIMTCNIYDVLMDSDRPFEQPAEKEEQVPGVMPEWTPDSNADEYTWRDVPVGQTKDLTDISLCVNEVFETRTLNFDGGVLKAKDGMKYVVVDMTLTNITDEPVSLAIDAGWPLYDSTGKEYKAQNLDMRTAPKYHDLAPDEVTMGRAYYIVDEESSGFYYAIPKPGSTDGYCFVSE